MASMYRVGHEPLATAPPRPTIFYAPISWIEDLSSWFTTYVANAPLLWGGVFVAATALVLLRGVRRAPISTADLAGSHHDGHMCEPIWSMARTVDCLDVGAGRDRRTWSVLGCSAVRKTMTVTNQDHDANVDLACCSPLPRDQENAAPSDHDPCWSVSAADIAALAAMDDIAQAAATSPEVGAVRSTGFKLLLDHGLPVEVEHWAIESGIDVVTLNETLETAGANGRVQFDGDGRLVGIAGLTVEPTRHELNVEGTVRWTWCALDAVGILGALEATGTIHSTDPHTGTAIVVDFVRGEPDNEATLFILGGYDGGNVVEDWCPLVNFFATRLDADEWVTAEGLDGDIVSVSSISLQAAEMWRSVVDSPPPEAHEHGESTMPQHPTEGGPPHGQ